MNINPVGFEYIKLSSESEKYIYEHINEKECQQLLFKGYIKLALKIASTFNVPGYDKEDIESEAFIALWSSVIKFNPDKNIKFISFAYSCIKNHLLRLLRKKNCDTLSLETDIGDGEDEINLYDIIDGTIEYYTFSERDDVIKNACEKALDDKERELIYLYYYKELTVRQIGLIKDTNGADVSRKLKKAREKILLYITTGRVVKKITVNMVNEAIDKFKKMIEEE